MAPGNSVAVFHEPLASEYMSVLLFNLYGPQFQAAVWQWEIQNADNALSVQWLKILNENQKRVNNGQPMKILEPTQISPWVEVFPLNAGIL